ncbi:hypothetical protein [Winogradskyella sp. UBA3174]|uniref:hypothetical protein n=1 Tax=Winogradskyella sp. UBA3174 TaxID=1947785 RepID=UPI0025CD702E|nr:hypothetical protein [Winogradskyella sp. UBA3174]
MEIQTLKAVSVKNSTFIILLLMVVLTYSCKDIISNNREGDLLKVIVNDIKTKSSDKIFYLDKNNSNELVLDRFDKYIKFNDIQSDSIVNIVFSKNEYENYKKQTSTYSNWNTEIEYINDNSIEWRNDTINKFIHISKPIYSINKKYALVYFLYEGEKEIYFMPKINVYYKRKYSWEKVFILPSRQFKK